MRPLAMPRPHKMMKTRTQRLMTMMIQSMPKMMPPLHKRPHALQDLRLPDAEDDPAFSLAGGESPDGRLSTDR